MGLRALRGISSSGVANKRSLRILILTARTKPRRTSKPLAVFLVGVAADRAIPWEPDTVDGRAARVAMNAPALRLATRIRLAYGTSVIEFYGVIVRRLSQLSAAI